MFKLTYQSFMMFSLTGVYIFIRLLKELDDKFKKILFFTVYFLLFTFIFIYPLKAIKPYYGLKNYQSLYGLNYLKLSYPNDYQAILWLKKNASGQPVIVEAVGESYTDFARVSANTGLPTILGWRVHEWRWRGSFDEAGKRTEEVSQIYQSPDLEVTKTLINRYQVRYIFLGDLEKQTYPDLQEEKLDKLAEVAYSSGETKIYRVKD